MDSRPLSSRPSRARLETSAGGVVYRLKGGEPHFLLIRDSYRNWGFPKGHLEFDEQPDTAAMREVREETGLVDVTLEGTIDTIDWYFRFRGHLVHKICHFFLMHTETERTTPQRDEGITACRWVSFGEASELVSYANAREVLRRAYQMIPDPHPGLDSDSGRSWDSLPEGTAGPTSPS